MTTSYFLPVLDFFSVNELSAVSQDPNIILTQLNPNFVYQVKNQIPNTSYIAMEPDNKTALKGRMIVKTTVSSAVTNSNIVYSLNTQKSTYQFYGVGSTPQESFIQISYAQISDPNITYFQWTKKDGSYYVNLSYIIMPQTHKCGAKFLMKAKK